MSTNENGGFKPYSNITASSFSINSYINYDWLRNEMPILNIQHGKQFLWVTK
jgi:hypothetical protein